MHLSRSLTAALATALLVCGARSQIANVVVVHGVPGTNVDVYLNNVLTLSDFAPGTVTGELSAVAGTTTVAITPVGGPIGSPLATLTANLAPNSFSTIVAHLDANGSVVLTPFANDVERAKAEKESSLVARHAAQTGDVTVIVRSAEKKQELARADNLTNGNEASVVLKGGGFFEVEILPAGSQNAVFGPTLVFVPAGSTLALYATGVPSSSFEVLGQSWIVATTARVDVVHGILGTPVDVYVNGALTIPNFQPSSRSGLVELGSGQLDVALTTVGGSLGSPILRRIFDLQRGQTFSLVAHLDAFGSPTLSAFEEDFFAVEAKQTRLVVRHGAEADPVDASFWKGKVEKASLVSGLVSGLANGESVELAASAGAGFLVVTAGGSRVVELPSLALRVDKKVRTVVYVFGSAAQQSLSYLVQELPAR